MFPARTSSNRIFTLLVQKTFEVTTNDVLTAVPLFLFMGYVVERANILDRLFRSIQLAAKNVPGSLAVATLITCAMFATATGIVGAVVTLMGLLALPAMLRAGYDTKLAAGVVCAGGCLGILIPPSILLILYAATAGISAVRLYAAALIPGFLLAGFYILYVIVRADDESGAGAEAAEAGDRGPAGHVIWALAHLVPPLALLIICVSAPSCSAWRRRRRPPASARSAGSCSPPPTVRSISSCLQESVYLTARATAMVCFLFIGSWTFSSVFAYLGGQGVIERFFLSLDLSSTRLPDSDAGHHLPARLAA